MKFPTYKEMGERIAEQALDEYVINGKTLREWIKLLSEQGPCDDVIDRAEAMTEIMMFAGNVKSDEEDVYIKVSDVVQLLRELPSVRPQPCDEYKQIRRVLKVIEMCEGIQANEDETFIGKETAKVVAYEHIAEILKGVQNDTKGS